VGPREAPARRRQRRPRAGHLSTTHGPAESTENDARHLDRQWLARHLADERREAELLGEIREALFGMQDGLVSTLAVVSTVGAASGDRFAVLVAGIASALAGVFSMAAGEYMSSKSQREIYVAQIENEREEVRDRPAEAEAEVAYMLEAEGLSEAAARRVAAELAREPTVLLKTMVEKELGLVIEEGPGALQGAMVMGGAFGLASLVPILPYLFLPIANAPAASIVLCGVVMFGIGAVKTRWTKRSPLRSGLEVVALAAFAGIAGYLFGSVLPSVLGFAGLGPL
jgi:VIT1/CCC1 family predicted Fe2+/Mn2+ transporter